MNHSMPILDIRNLQVGFKTETGISHAIHDLSFTLGHGETIGIVGESGSGKSVTSLAIMRLIPNPPGQITRGEILFQQGGNSNVPVDLVGLSDQKMRAIRGKEIAMIFQEPMTSLNPVLTCGYQVTEAIQLHQKGISKREAKERTLELFNKVKLPRPEKILNAYPHEISGGQKQRVMIAMAISCNPSVLIADEPTTALDVTVQATILDLLRQLQAEQGMSMIFISHDLGVVAEIADRVLVMYKGNFVEEGKTKDVFRAPTHPYTKGLLACRPSLSQKLRRLPVLSDFMKTGEQGEVEVIPVSVDDVKKAYIVDLAVVAAQREFVYKQVPVLDVDQLKTWFPLKTGLFNREKQYVKAVDNVSFQVFPGETLGLVGESGCGKSTLGRTILRLIEPHSGRVLFKGKDLAQLNRKEMRLQRKHLQIIFQDPYSSLNPRMTAGEAILEPMHVHGLHDNADARKKRVMELLDRVNLPSSCFNRYPHEFSGGQRQRIVIARALALQPEFIICDESVSALDVSVQAQVLNLLNDLKNDFGLSYIFISHDLSVVKFMSDRMLVMNAGKIEEIGDPEEVYRSPASEYTKNLIAAIPKGL